MGKSVAFYQTCIKKLLSEYETLNTHDTRIRLCFDDERKVYLVLRVGWLVIEANNTEDPIDKDLIALGIPEENICLGFVPADFRAYAEQHSRRIDIIG